MNNLAEMNNSYNDGKVIDACSIFGVMDVSGKRFSGKEIARAIANMHDRGNGLGGGFAVYGLYPDYADDYAFHIMYLSQQGQQETEAFLKDSFDLIFQEKVPTRSTPAITNPPMIYRYFLNIGKHDTGKMEDDDYVVDRVMTINSTLRDSFVFSSGKDMAVFKGVGYPEEIADYFCLEQYEGYLWTAHGRFPTNSVAWWGGAHPFSILDWTVVHNGEISSYGINRRYLEQYGYQCTMHTDTEVIAYAVDLLVRKHGLPFEIVASILSSPLWEDIGRMPVNKQDLHRSLRQIYGSLLLNGPFTVIIAHQGEMIGLTDRIRLRPLTAGVKGSKLYLSSEEASIRLVCRDLEQSWIPLGGQLIVGRLGEPIDSPVSDVVDKVLVIA